MTLGVLVSSAQAITYSYPFKTFGEELATTGSTADILRAFGMFGYQSDAASRLWVRARALDVVKWRWDRRDRLGFRGGDRNLYRYAANRPSTRFDPSGLKYKCPIPDVNASGFDDAMDCANDCALEGGNAGELPTAW